MVSYCVRYARIVPLILSVYYMSRYQNFVLSQVVQVSWVIMKGKALESNYLYDDRYKRRQFNESLRSYDLESIIHKIHLHLNLLFLSFYAFISDKPLKIPPLRAW